MGICNSIFDSGTGAIARPMNFQGDEALELVQQCCQVYNYLKSDVLSSTNHSYAKLPEDTCMTVLCLGVSLFIRSSNSLIFCWIAL